MLRAVRVIAFEYNRFYSAKLIKQFINGFRLEIIKNKYGRISDFRILLKVYFDEPNYVVFEKNGIELIDICSPIYINTDT